MLDKSDSIYLILIFLFMKYFKLFRINIKNKVRFYGINFVIYMIIFYVIKYLIVNVTKKKLIEGHKFYIHESGELAVDDTTSGEAHLCEIVYGYSDINLMDDAEQICKEPVEGGPGNCSEYPGSECPIGCNLSNNTKIPGDRFECSDGPHECWRRAFINQNELEKNHCIYDEENDNWVPNPTNNTIMSMSTLGRNIECKCNVNQHRHPEDNEQDCGTDADTGETVEQQGRNCNLFPLENLRQNNGNLCTSPTEDNDSCNDNTVSSDIIDILLENDCSMLDGEYRINDKCKDVIVDSFSLSTSQEDAKDYVTSDLARYIIDEKCGEFVNTNNQQCIARDLSINDETDSDEVQAGGYLFCINPVDTTDDNSCEDNTISEETFQDIISQDLNVLEIYNRINNECGSVQNINGQQCIANPDIFTINTDCQGHWSECGEDLSYCQSNGEKLEGVNQDECTGGDEWIEDIVDQCERKYVIDQPTSGQGVACEYSEGETETCQAGEGQCPTPPSWHIAGDRQTCSNYCSSIGKTCGVNTNSFSNGGIFAEDLEGATVGDGDDAVIFPTFTNQRWYGDNTNSTPLQSRGGVTEITPYRYNRGSPTPRIDHYNDWNDYGTPDQVNSLEAERPTLHHQPILDFFSDMSINGEPVYIDEKAEYSTSRCHSHHPAQYCRGGHIKNPYMRTNYSLRDELRAAGFSYSDSRNMATRLEYDFYLPNWKLNWENRDGSDEESFIRSEDDALDIFCNTASRSYIPREDRNICWCE